MTVNLLTEYKIPEAIDLIQDTDDFANGDKILSMADVKTKDHQKRKAWQRIFDFRQAMKEREVSIEDDRAKKLVEVYNKYHCSQDGAHRLTGIPRATVGRISRRVQRVRHAYLRARNYRRRQSKKRRKAQNG